jgi:Ankyrin repeats (3 copies)/Ankyrin repeat
MSRVKLLKSELWDNDIPALCMICGENPAQTKHEMVARHVFFPLNLLGILGVYATPKKMPMAVACCNDCKGGYLNEVNMGIVWQVLRTLVLVGFIITFTTYSSSLPKSLLPPVIFAVIAFILETVYFWSIGRKHAIRCAKMDEGTVSLDLPTGKWGVAYTTYKREKNQKRKATKAPVHDAPAPTQDDGPAPSPGQAPTINQAFGAPGEQEISGIDFTGVQHANLPPELPDVLAAVKEGDSEILEEVLKKGGDIHEKMPNGMNGLHLAAIAGLMQMADLLIRRGIPVNSEMDNGLTAMHLAVQSNNQSIVGLLLAKKGDPNHRNAEGLTPLHWCAGVNDERLDPNNRYKMAKMLLRGGGDIAAKDNKDRTPADLAKMIGDTQVAETLS